MGGGVRRVSVAKAGRQGLVELEARIRICVRGIEGGGLVKQEVALWRAPSGGEGRGAVWEALTPRNIRCAGAPIRDGGEWRRRRAGR